MRILKKVKVNIRGEELSLTPKQLFIKLRKFSVWDMEEFLKNNSTDLELDRQYEKSCANLDQPIYPNGWYEKQDEQIIKGEKNGK